MGVLADFHIRHRDADWCSAFHIRRIIGTPGTAGKTGVNGTKGTDGKAGADGTKGTDGTVS